jgi:hypothetical protein
MARRDVLKIQGSADLGATLVVERELRGDTGWVVSIQNLEGNELLAEVTANQRDSRELFKDYCRRALELVLA